MISTNVLRAVFASVVCVAAARAGTTTFTSESAWDAAIGATPLTTLDFEGTVPPNGVAGSDGQTYGAGPNGQWTSSLVNTGVTFTSTSAVFYVSSNLGFDGSFHTSNYLNWQGASNPDFGTLTVSLPTPTTAFGFLIGSFNSSGGTADITIGGSTISAAMPSDAYGFFGVTSTNAISSFTVHGLDNYTTMDHFQFAQTATSSVPDSTSTLLLFGLGTGLLAFSRRRRG